MRSFFFNDTATTEIYTLSLHDALPIFGANATIVCGTVLGGWAMVAAGAVVTRDVEPHQLVMGNPARAAGWVCECGELVSRAAEQPGDLRCTEHRDRTDRKSVAEGKSVDLG